MSREGRFSPALLLLLSLRLAVAVSVVARQPNDEDFVLEHEVPAEQALDNARGIKLYPGPIPGCKSCTAKEMTYCQDGSVLQDHCCCDASYNEVLGFVEHTCRLHAEACKVLAGDCAEYTRLRECCCHPYLASLWKYLAGGTAPTKMSCFLVGISLLLVLISAIR